AAEHLVGKVLVIGEVLVDHGLARAGTDVEAVGIGGVGAEGRRAQGDGEDRGGEDGGVAHCWSSFCDCCDGCRPKEIGSAAGGTKADSWHSLFQAGNNSTRDAAS